MRTKKSIKNVVIAGISYILIAIIGFVSRSLFLNILGAEYLGINSLFANVVSVLNVVELGFGSAIIFNMYKPLSDNDFETIKSLMEFYKKVYRIIAAIVLGLGIVVMIFIPNVVGQVTILDNLQILFLLWVFDTVVSYLLSHKRSIFIADQKNYVVNLIHTITYLISNIVQILLLYKLRNYYLYLVFQIAFHIIENIAITVAANRSYSYISGAKIFFRLNDIIYKDIVKKVKGLIFHQIGAAVVLGTDNIIISMTKGLGIVAVGKYSNYILLINNLNGLTQQIFVSVTSSVGNLLVEKDTDKSYIVYKRILYLNALLYIFICVSVFLLMEPFICLWIGKEYLLDVKILLIIIFNLFIQGMKRTCGIFKNAAGIYYEDRFVPLMESVLNLIFSVILVKYVGLAGVCLGTIISSIVHWGYDFPKYVYGNIFKRRYIFRDYIKDYGKYVITFFISFLSAYIVYEFVLNSIGNDLLRFILSMFCSFAIPCIVFFVMLSKTDEKKYWNSYFKSKMSSLVAQRDK